MVQSPSWEANWFAASREIPRISRNPKVHYRTHKRPPPPEQAFRQISVITQSKKNLQVTKHRPHYTVIYSSHGASSGCG